MLPWLAVVLLSQSPQPVENVTEAEREAIAKAGLTDAAVAKLSAEQLHDVLVRQQKRGADEVIPIVAITGSYLLVALVVIAVVFALLRAAQLRAQTLRAMVEKGVQIPPELIAPRPRPDSDLRRGVLLCCFGVGLGIFLLSVADTRGVWTLSLVPLLVGVGYLVSFRLTRSEPAAPSSASAA